MLKDAVAKWNDEVPFNSVEDFWRDYDRITGKLVKLPNYNEATEGVVEKMRERSPEPEIFVEVMDATKKYFDFNFVNIARDLVSAYVSRDQDRIVTTYSKIKESGQTFVCSQKADLLLSGSGADARQEVRLIDDALLALDRIYPNRKIAPSGTLILRDLVTVNHMNVTESDLSIMRLKFKSLYNFRVHSGYMCPTSVCLSPKSSYISEEVIQEIYGITLDNLSVFGLIESERGNSPWFITEDPNISISAILSKITGSSMTSLSTVVSDLVGWVSMVYLSRYQCTPEIALEATRKNPWMTVPDAMLFISPHLLYCCAIESKSTPSRLVEDFKMMTRFMELYRIYMASHAGVDFNPMGAPHIGMSRPENVRTPRQATLYPDISGSLNETHSFSNPSMIHEIHMLLSHSESCVVRLKWRGDDEHANNLAAARAGVLRLLNQI
jgi:hypothetical protein